MAEITFSEGTTYTHRLPENHNAFVYVLSGELEFGESKTAISKTGVATFTYNKTGEEQNTSELVITAKKRSKILVYSGVPMKEEVVAYGPFVMNYMEEIREAYRDF